MERIKNYIIRRISLHNFCLSLLMAKRHFMFKHFFIHTTKQDFRKNLAYNLNLANPQTFNEKIQWLKVHYRNPIMSKCADKVAVRDIVAEKIGKEYLTPIYGVWDSVDDININGLPNEFVLKPNHSSGRVIICKDKEVFNWNVEFAKLRKWMKENYYYQNGEWVYKNIKPKIICEKLLSGSMIDYKFMCFHGEPRLLFTCSDRETDLKVTFFDLEFIKLPFIRKYKSSNIVKKPQKFEKMIELSKVLASDFAFVRVDFYENQGNIYFGELTFFPGNGMECFEPIEWDKKIGDMLDLSRIEKEHCI
ncbi:MAG TPA: glycosyl transferase [Clostridiales bacterium]|nr:glycosyl transferase [Clostridiales bacterium]